ncbi:EZH inhibitory protein-like [Choloepus didactylus]|uniref:EZH inhibitory protein-like n=1 Tax=Choloepus didactylus TaxID=27675 RepID=UPI00189D000A|nr:EZH inhibitory protein-like [Choloepus didactylus]
MQHQQFLLIALYYPLLQGMENIIMYRSYMYLMLHTLCSKCSMQSIHASGSEPGDYRFNLHCLDKGIFSWSARNLRETTMLTTPSLECSFFTFLPFRPPSTPTIYPTPSYREKDQKKEQFESTQGKMPRGPKNKVGPACVETSSSDLVAQVPAESSDGSPSGPLHNSTEGSSTAAADSIIVENPGMPSKGCVQTKRRSDLLGSQSSPADLRCAVAETSQDTVREGRKATMGKPTRGIGQIRGHPNQIKSPGNNRGKKYPYRGEPAQSQKPLSPLLSSQASTRSHTSRQAPALEGQAAPPGPALRSRASRPGPALRSRATPPGPALRSRTSRPGFAIPSHAAPSGPALCSRATPPGPALRSRASSPNPALRSRATPPGPALRSRASSPNPALRSRATPPGPALRSRASRRSPTLCSRATPPGRARRSRATTPGPVVRSRAKQRRSALRKRPSLPGPTGRSPASTPGSLVLGSRPSSPDPEAPRLASQPGRALRMRASSPSPPGRFFFFPFFGQRGESVSSSSPGSPSQGRSSSPSGFSDWSASSSSPSPSPGFLGLNSISTPSPASLRRVLLPELDSLSPAFPAE